MNFQDMIAKLLEFWAKQGCLVHQGYDLEVGAGTFNPATFLRCLGPEPYSAVYVEPSRRPQDGRYGLNPNRLQFYHQMQVILKPSPANILELYIASLKEIGLKLHEHDIRFVHDDWENPTIGAWGLGWEIWLDGMEVTQFTYFQAIGGLPVNPVSGEITYGLERLAMYLQGVDSFFDLKWNDEISYGAIFQRNEYEWSHYNFHEADAAMWHRHFDDFEKEANRLLEKSLPIPAYDFVMKASHAFNILDARGVISVTERTGYMARIRNLAKSVAQSFVKTREEQNYPLLGKSYATPPLPKKETASASFDPSKKEDFLLEIGSEELPATFVPIGMSNLEKEIVKLLKSHELSFDKINVYGAPRRLAIYISGLPLGTVAQKTEKKGPSVQAAFDEQGKPTEIGKGFFRSLHADPVSLKELTHPFEIRKVKDVDYLYAHIEKPGVSTKALLASHLPGLILGLDFPKKMRWGSFEIEYARPLRWIVALLGKEVIPFTIADIESGNHSYGHRQISPKEVSLSHPSEYLEKLKKHHVLVDPAARKEMIREGLKKIEAKLEAKVVSEERVMAQVLHLVEWPFIDVCAFDPKFLKAPKEILISEMIEHQKYFPLIGKNGELIAHFVICSNNETSDKIRHGNQKALTPRLADGLFLYEEDLKTPLEKYNEKLKTVTFQKELGSVWQKVERLKEYVPLLKTIPGDQELAKRAAHLAKADLVTQLVGEFPELQGTVGKFYAEKSGEKKEVAIAIDEQWMPRGEKAPLPQTPVGITLSIAEKIDNLLSCFALGLVPTSSSDPYALRRQALGILKMILDGKITLPLKKTFSDCCEVFLKHTGLKNVDRQKVLNEIQEFLVGRARTILGDHFEKDEIESVLSEGMDDFLTTYQKLTLISKIRKEKPEQFAALHQIHTRAKKILQGQKAEGNLNASLLREPAEKELFAALQKVKGKTTFEGLSELEKPVNTLFDTVKIMDEDAAVRNNRLLLLKEVKEACSTFCDFEKIQSKEESVLHSR